MATIHAATVSVYNIILNEKTLFYFNKFFFDFRVGWDFMVATWSNMNHSSAKIDLTGFPPTGSINIGYSF